LLHGSTLGHHADILADLFTAAINHLIIGTMLEVVGRIFGHASILITADGYCHVSRGEMHEEQGEFAPMNVINK